MDGLGEPIPKPGEECEASLASDVEAKGEGARCAQSIWWADAPMSKSPSAIVDEGEVRRFVLLVGGESSRRSMSLSPRATAVSRKVSNSR